MNNRGSAIAIVLLVLGLVSLLGVALIMQSRMDLQLTASLRSFDMMFGLADGGSSVCFNDLYTRNREAVIGSTTATWTYDVVPTQTVEVSRTSTYDSQTHKTVLGQYKAQVMFTGYSTNPADAAGWDVNSYFPEYWLGRGEGSRAVFAGSLAKADSAVTKFKKK